MPRKAPPTRHRWRFYRAGGVDQVMLDSGDDLFHLHELDLKLWVALSCPVAGLEFDEKTLAALDTDGDGHVRPPEILAAIAWLKRVLKHGDGVADRVDGVPLDSIRSDTAEGKAVLRSARHVLKSLGRGDAKAITVADSLAAGDALRVARHNGDGIVPPESIDDAALRAAAEAIIACTGGETDRSGAQGISRATVQAFFEAAEAFVAWARRGQSGDADLLPLGDRTTDAAAALNAVRTKIDDWFARCNLAEFDPRAQEALNRQESAYLELAALDLSIESAEVADFPLAMVMPAAPLPLDRGLNPAWRSRIVSFRKACVEPLLGDTAELGEAAWNGLKARFAPFVTWQAERDGAAVEALGLTRVEEILADDLRAGLEQAIADDEAVAAEFDEVENVERLARYHRDLAELLDNYVSFRAFYDHEQTAIFQAGVLYLDSRATSLCVEVTDPAKHVLLAGMAKTYLAYVDLTRPGGQKKTVACAMTAGDSDNLFVGRNGLFYDRKGDDWDATVSRIIEQPISIGQAFWSPYKKLLRWIEEQVAKRAAAADEASVAKLQAGATAAGDAATTGTAAARPKFDIGVVAALGVAVGGITAAMGALLDAFFGLGFWMPLGVLGLVLLISGPAMVIAWMKLRERNLGPILDANGWAVNTLTKVNLPLGRSLTDSATLPPGSARTLKDPYAPKKHRWPWLLLLIVLLGAAGWGAWRLGYLHEHLEFLPAPPSSEAAPTETGG